MLPQYLQDNLDRIQKSEQEKFKITQSFRKFEKPVIQNIIKDHLDGNESYIGREDVLEYFKRNDDYTGFFAVMVWGGISTGGMTGDNLTSLLRLHSSVIENIVKDLREQLSDDKVGEAFQYMDSGKGKLKGLGESYFTKLFFFIAAAEGATTIPPIFDKWTKFAFCALLIDLGECNKAKRYISSITDFLPHIRTAHKVEAYKDFVELMNQWARECGTSVDKLETFIFGKHRGKYRTTENSRNYFDEYINTHCKTALGFSHNKIKTNTNTGC
ncbi:hypothetical protein [Vibrio sp. D431a]|uniref:8-oxoguanine DNA glycosylase OGG fold protein n=1 Tax=Vibrio sp. D431a TaxID=2837388 RepID=UPI002553F041|nr:hypothetical protein [Vibrio sp. D431a]MDK9793757.1 hypothetical protein [Vibrio sp. D431a]